MEVDHQKEHGVLSDVADTGTTVGRCSVNDTERKNEYRTD
jgi:hypothetical protein